MDGCEPLPAKVEPQSMPVNYFQARYGTRTRPDRLVLAPLLLLEIAELFGQKTIIGRVHNQHVVLEHSGVAAFQAGRSDC